jgi:hypothetical protein
MEAASLYGVYGIKIQVDNLTRSFTQGHAKILGENSFKTSSDFGFKAV